MKTVVRWCAVVIGIGILLATPDSLVRAIHFVGTFDPITTDDSTLIRVVVQSLLYLRLAAIWVVLRMGWSLLPSGAKVRKFQPRPLPNFENYRQWRKSWTR